MTEAVNREQIAHAYIIEAPWSFDKEAYAFEFAKTLLCENGIDGGCGRCPACKKVDDRSHIDITFIEAKKTGKSKVASIKDADMANVQERLAKSPMDGERNIAIIKDADTMSEKAANRFLKTLEEPACGTVIMLLSENANDLPATIRSRCVVLRVGANTEKSFGEVSGRADRITDLLKSGGFYFELKEEIEDFTSDRKDAFALIDAMEESWLRSLSDRAMRADRKKAYRAVECLENAREEIKRGNNIAFSLKKMILTIGG